MGNSQELVERYGIQPSSAPAFAGRRRGPAAKSKSSKVTRSPVGRAPAGLNASEHPAPTENPHERFPDNRSGLDLSDPAIERRQWLDENVVAEPWQWVEGAL